MPLQVHEDMAARPAQGLGCINNLIDVNGNGTDWGNSGNGATNAATFNAITAAKVGSSSYHEADKAIFVISQRVVTSMNAMAIFTNTNIANGVSSATLRSPFTTADPSLSATQRGTRGMN